LPGLADDWLDVAGQINAPITGPVDQGVSRVAVRGDGGCPHCAVIVADVVRLLEDGGSSGSSVRDAPVDVRHFEGEVDHSVTVAPMVVEVAPVRAHSAEDDETGRA